PRPDQVRRAALAVHEPRPRDVATPQGLDRKPPRNRRGLLFSLPDLQSELKGASRRSYVAGLAANPATKSETGAVRRPRADRCSIPSGRPDRIAPRRAARNPIRTRPRRCAPPPRRPRLPSPRPALLEGGRREAGHSP